jgi:capsular exopolysaccharide synthesis family protein
MDTIDRSHSNLPAPFSAPLVPAPALTPALPADPGATPTIQISPKVLLRGVTRHWWRILLLWLFVSAPIAFAIFQYIQPTFEAFSLLRIEPAAPELFQPIKGSSGDGRSYTYLQTQTELIASPPVLVPVVANPLVTGIAMIKNSKDPESELRKKLMVEIVGETNLIRVAMESTEPEDATTIVNAVVESYMLENARYKRGANKELTDVLAKQMEKIKADIETNKKTLKRLLKNGKVSMLKPEEMLNSSTEETDPAKPTFKKSSADHVQRMMAEMHHTDLSLLEARAQLEVKLANAMQQEEKNQTQQGGDQLNEKIEEEFNKDPEVVALVDEIDEVREHLEHVKQNVRNPSDPSRVHAQKQLEKLMDRYERVWKKKYTAIRERLSLPDGGSKSDESVKDLTLKIATLEKKKLKEIELFKGMEVDQKESNDDTFEATYLEYQIRKMQSREDQIERNLVQLEFEAKQDRYRVSCIAQASVPKTPSNNKRLKYMAAAPMGVFLMMLGLFLVLEIKAERVADPDALSTRVRSEVYSLPPLPTARSIRRLSTAEADDQISQFIQRLDHLRFAVCANSSELGKGRCVLITSAIGGEGKTTLAAQLAARCGNAGMSTLLIDSDFRRTALCPLLDVPEGPGLSDVLKDEADLNDVVIPVQGGTFYLLSAGTPIQDTARVLQSAKFGQLLGLLRQRYDLIIIDSPPVLPVPDALVLGRWADGAIIAARYDISRFPQVERARRQLDNAGIAILGTVINGMRHSDSYYGRYTYRRQRSNQADSTDTI